MTATLPTVGLALIVKNEESSLPSLLESVAGAFDQVVLVDTGSTDHTIEVFTRWAGEQPATGRGFDATVHRFDWVDDFAAARAYADSFLTTEWNAWADADDILQGASNLRVLAAQAPPELAGYIFDYSYAFDHHGNCVCTLKRERLVRRGSGHWVGRVHEAQIMNGATMLVDPQTALWVHRKQPVPEAEQPRNLRILRAWHRDIKAGRADQAELPRVLGYLGTEEAARGNHKDAVKHYRGYLRLVTGWPEERAQIHRKLSLSLMALGQPEKARAVALEALTVVPGWTDNYLSLAQAHYHLGEYDKAEHWARETLQRGQPDTLLIINPADYTWEPRLCLSAALGAQGKVDEAIQVAEEALAIIPDHPELRQHHHGWKATAKREHTANTFAGSAELLIAHDEQLKALMLLEECVPHFATDHPRVVQLRSALRERIRPLLDAEGMREHYTGTEDGMPLDVAATLPRAQFLVGGLREQFKEAA